VLDALAEFAFGFSDTESPVVAFEAVQRSELIAIGAVANLHSVAMLAAIRLGKRSGCEDAAQQGGG